MSPTTHAFVVLLSVSSVLFILRLARRRAMRAKYAFLWLSVGGLMVIFSISPRLLDRFSVWIGIGYGPTTLFLIAIVLLLLTAVHFSWELSRLEERTRTLAEEVAILRVESGADDDQ